MRNGRLVGAATARLLALFGTAALAAGAGAVATAQQDAAPPGDAKSTTTKVLETGAGLAQGNAPAEQLVIHLVGFHPLKDDPAHQMEAHHYCRQVNEDFAQCALFDGDGAEANLNGIEYIISAKLFAGLPADEKAYWHPHDYEILSGQLVAPGIPRIAEHRLMADKMNSYGKTWHVWSTGTSGAPADALPLGAPRLAWSFNRDGEARPELVQRRDQRLGIDSAKVRAARQDLVSVAQPQCGVDALAGRFAGSVSAIPGVRARADGCGSTDGGAIGAGAAVAPGAPAATHPQALHTSGATRSEPRTDTATRSEPRNDTAMRRSDHGDQSGR